MILFMISLLVIAFLAGRLMQVGHVKKLLPWSFNHRSKPVTMELTGDEARAVDESNPPYYANYKRRGYVEAEAPECSCHQGRKVQAGERVLIWPIPNHPDGAVDIFCMETCYQASQS